MIQIQPFVTTNENLIATQLEVSKGDINDVSVDAAWRLYDSNGGYVNNGAMQLGGDDFAAYLENEGYLIEYVVKTLGLTIIN